MSRDTPPHCVLGPRPGRYARRYRLSAPALWHPSRGHPCAARMQTQLNTLRLQSSIFLATSCWNQPGPLCPLMAVMSVAGHWPVPLHMRQPSTSNSQLPLTAPGSHTPPDALRLCLLLRDLLCYCCCCSSCPHCAVSRTADAEAATTAATVASSSPLPFLARPSLLARVARSMATPRDHQCRCQRQAVALFADTKISKNTGTGIRSQYCLNAKPLASVPRRQLTSRILAEKGMPSPYCFTI